MKPPDLGGFFYLHILKNSDHSEIELSDLSLNNQITQIHTN